MKEPTMFRFKNADYNTDYPHIMLHKSCYIGQAVNLFDKETIIECIDDHDILNLFFMLQVSKEVPEVIPPVLPRTFANKITNIVGFVIVVICAIAGFIYLTT